MLIMCMGAGTVSVGACYLFEWLLMFHRYFRLHRGYGLVAIACLRRSSGLCPFRYLSIGERGSQVMGIGEVDDGFIGQFVGLLPP